MFVIYINKIVSVLQHSTYFMYADDLAILVSHSDPYMVQTLLQLDLNAISSWCDTYRLTVNSDKTHVLWCQSDRDKRNLSILDLELKNRVLRVVVKFNYLGVLIDKHLSFEAQCSRVVNSGNVKLKHLRRLKKHMDQELSLLMYKQMILPSLEYCDFVLESGPVGLVEEVQTIQNHCLRCCLGIVDPRLITRIALHTECKCKWLGQRRKENLLVIMYKHTRDEDNLIVPGRVLRSNVMRKVKLQRPSGQLYRDSPLYRGAMEWDKLTVIEQDTDSCAKFAQLIKEAA